MSKPVLLFYCQHSMGMGHLVRACALAEGLATHFDVLLLTGGDLPAVPALPSGVTLVALPPLGMDADGQLTETDPDALERIRQARVARVITTCARIRPACVLVELFPFGRKKFAFEILPLLELARSLPPAGRTARRVAALVHEVLAERGETIEFRVVSNPEFLEEGAAVQDFLHPDHIVVGADNAMAAQFMKDLNAAFGRDHAQLLVMGSAAAELTKYAANLRLATRISLMNELAGIDRATGADVEQVRLGIGSDPRIGPQFLTAGCG